MDTKLVKPYIIGVCGASCSGKSRVCTEISNKIIGNNKNVTILSQDRYYKGGNILTNYDKPDAIDFKQFISDLDKLREWLSIDAPIYDFTTHSRKKLTCKIDPKPIIIVEGIFVLYNEDLRKRFDLKIFVDAEPALCFSRRLERDVKERGRNQQEVTERYLRDVIPSNTIYVNPSKNWSDIVLMNNINDQFIGLEILNNHIVTKIKEMKKIINHVT